MSAKPFWPSKPKPPQKLTGTYEQLRAAAREQSAVLRGYSRECPFGVGDLVAHPTHGVSVVTEAPSLGKGRVLFADRGQLLMCGIHGVGG